MLIATDYPKNGLLGKRLIYPKFVAAAPAAIRHNPGMIDEAYWDRIRERMAERRLSQTAMAQELGLPSQSAFSNLMKGKRQLKATEKIALEHFLRIEGESNVHQVPIIGFTQAGQWREAIQLPQGHMPLLAGIAGRNAFAVEVRGDSMDLFVREGGYAVVDPDRRQLFDQSVYLLENDEYETTMKQYRTNPARFCPMSSNPEHKPFGAEEGRHRVIGKVVWTGSRAP